MTSQEEWNDFAQTYATVQQESRLPIEIDVVQYLAQRLPLKTLTVVDVAAGTGRYALPLTQAAQSVELIDWAENMLKLADQWLTAHDQTNYRLTSADWHTLPAKPRADLAFVSQLPTLTPADLPKLRAFGRRALVLNLQTQAASSLLTKMADALNTPTPTSPQANPARAMNVSDYLTTNHISYHTHDFHYTLPDQASVSDLLTNFDQPFSVREANQLAEKVTGTANANQMQTITRDYTYQLMIIPAGH